MNTKYFLHNSLFLHVIHKTVVEHYNKQSFYDLKICGVGDLTTFYNGRDKYLFVFFIIKKKLKCKVGGICKVDVPKKPFSNSKLSKKDKCDNHI